MAAYGRLREQRGSIPRRGKIKCSPKILAIAGALALAVGLIGGLASSAQATSLPVVYNYVEGWANPHVRPNFIAIGMGGAPFVQSLHWSTWNSRGAKATGTLVLDSCKPDCAQGAISRYRVDVALSGVKHHRDRAYFSVMTWHVPGYLLYSHGRWVKTVTLRFIRGYWAY